MTRTKERARKHGGRKTILGNDSTWKSAKGLAPKRPQQTEYDETFAPRDPSLLSDTFAQAIKRHYGDSTSIEQGDLHLAPRAFRDTTAFGQPRIAQELPEYVKTFLRDGDSDPSTSTDKAAPHTMVIVSSGIRASDLVRELRVFASSESKVGKYFAKHMKLNANIEFSKNSRVGIAVGTPGRLKELVENDAIRVESLQRIIIDGSYQNPKKYNIFDMEDSFKPMLGLLNIREVKSRLLDDDDKLQTMIF